MDRYNNIFLSDITDKYNFSSVSKMGPEFKIPNRPNVKSHSEKLLNEFHKAQKEFNAFLPEKTLAKSFNDGLYVEFSGADNCELITGSLENESQGIKLLNVRNVCSESKNITKATVFIPRGKEDVFLRKIRDFGTKKTKTGKPKNNNLVSSIETIENAVKISAFWVGSPKDLPNDNKQWYELWFDIDGYNFKHTKDIVFRIFDELGLEHRREDEFVYFPDRCIIPVYANCSDLLCIIKQGATIAEIRKPADPNTFFYESQFSDQEEWSEDLLDRIDFNDSNVAVSILDTGVNCQHKLVSKFVSANPETINKNWTVKDKNGHGTGIAGIVLYNDLKNALLSNKIFPLNHTIESIKIIDSNYSNNTSNTLYGYVMNQAVSLSEIANSKYKHIYCMAVTDSTSSSNNGEPSSWSASLDSLSSNNEGRLFIVSAGNVNLKSLENYGYPDACLNTSVEDPGQSWNAITVGAYSNDELLPEKEIYKGYSRLTKPKELSPYSSTSFSWKNSWPIKPEIVCDGGDVASDGNKYFMGADELSKLTLNKDILSNLFNFSCATSAATAQCSYIAAELFSMYPDMRPETLRGLIIHSARWSKPMLNQFCIDTHRKRNFNKLLRTCGYGIPNLDIARDTLNNRVNMILEEEIQPYKKTKSSDIKMNEMHIHTLPWPEMVLQSLENETISVRITLSYFIEPSPGEKGWKNKYRYSSCGLRFDMKRPNETLDQFKMRINNAMRDDDYVNIGNSKNNWLLGPNNRDVGSIHSDVWTDSAINLAQSGYIAIYPVVGWWKERTKLKKYNSKIHYSLIVSIETDNENIDLYTPIMTKIESKIAVPILAKN